MIIKGNSAKSIATCCYNVYNLKYTVLYWLKGRSVSAYVSGVCTMLRQQGVSFCELSGSGIDIFTTVKEYRVNNRNKWLVTSFCRSLGIL